jgi:hypothetical protein
MIKASTAAEIRDPRMFFFISAILFFESIIDPIGGQGRRLR